MSEADREIPGLLRLNEPVLHNSALILGLEPLRIQTPAQSWAYALAIPVDSENLSGVDRDRRLAVELELEVEYGEIGVGALTEDLQTFVSTEVAVTAESGRASIRLDVDDLERFSWLMIRSGPRRQRSPILRIHTVKGYVLEKKRRRDIWEVPPPIFGTLVERGGVDSTLILSHPTDSERAVAGLHRYLALVRESSPRGTKDVGVSDNLALPDDELKNLWLRHHEAGHGERFRDRGWSHLLYRDFLRGKKILIVGSGFGLDGIAFAQSGAQVVFLEICEERLETIRRLCRLFQLEDVGCQHFGTVESIDQLAADFDVVWCRGSLSHVPFKYALAECDALLRRLPVGGRWIELAYPKSKWECEGRLPFSQWSQKSGHGCDLWMEWYDLKKWSERMRSAEFDPVLQFSSEKGDFCWFDMIRTK